MSTGPSEPERRTLRVPPAHSSHYSRNLIKTAVCELRFPTLFELESSRPPPEFARMLRRQYPNYEFRNDVRVDNTGVDRVPGHFFMSKKRSWTVVLRTFSVTLETSRYDSYSDFAERLRLVIEAASSVIDSEFFTRIGLRYINVLPPAIDELEGWVSPSLVAPLTDGVFGDVQEMWQRVRGFTDVGGFTFHHGVRTEPDTQQRYVLDFDLFRDDAVDLNDALGLVSKLHDFEFALFSWAIGPKAREYLGPSLSKSR